MDKLFLKKDLVTENTLTQDGVLSYIALRIIMDESIPLYNKASTVDCVSVNRMAYVLMGSQEKYEKVFLDSLQRGIFELQLAEAIKILQDYSTKKSNEYLLDFSAMYLDTQKEQFVTIFPEEVHKILTCNESMKKKISMLKYFIALISTFNWSKAMRNLQGKIGSMSMEYIALQAGNSSRTCIRYNDVLSKLKLIYIYKSNDKVREDDKLRQIKNCYSRYADKDVCEEYASNYENWYGVQHRIVLTQKNKEQADYNRRLAAIYNRICDGYGDSYDKATISEVHKYVVNKNKAIQREIDAKYNQEYLTDSDKRWVQKLKEQLRDESVFEQFGFLKEEHFPNEVDDNWGEVIDFTIEEILDMPVMGEVVTNNSEAPTIPSKTDVMNDNESHDNSSHGIFCVTGNDSELIDINDLY